MHVQRALWSKVTRYLGGGTYLWHVLVFLSGCIENDTLTGKKTERV
jgi:hypothetical protein